VEAIIMFCARCGKEVPEGTRFCQACGQEVSGTAAGAPSTPLPYAGFWIRFAAHLIDSFIVGIPLGIVLVALVFMLAGAGAFARPNPPVEPGEAAARFAPLIFAMLFPAILLVVIAAWLYYAGMESSARQATFGKSLMSLRVTNGEGQRLSFGHATGRYFAKIISGLIPFAIGYIMAGFTAKKQALHDLIAGTLVLRS
jgi:uncharacterized RDD family membrane protein YckC